VTGDFSGKIFSVNKACEKFGFQREQFIEKNLSDFLSTEESAKIIKNYEELKTGKSVFWEVQVQVLGNRIFEVKTDPSMSNGKVIGFQTIMRDIAERKKMEKQLEQYSKNLEELIDDRTQELKETQQQLVKSERLAAIGELAGLIGHDLRNPLSGIKNAAYYLKKKGSTISEVQAKQILEVIDKSIAHSDKIINNLIEYSKEMQIELQESSPHDLSVDALASIQISKQVQILNETSEEPTISVDKEKMLKVFTNMIENALDAMPNGGTLEIRSRKIDSNVEISFSDTGSGIKDEVLQRIFLPLFTTKAQGMGFGLAISKRIITAHGGKISVETQVDKGTTFRVVLPIEPTVEFEKLRVS